jgi:succinate dehydrogenase/fumarate reductase cytochrome b subunit
LSKNILHRVSVDAAMFLTMASSLVSGVVLWLALPNGRRSGYETFLGVAKTLWVDFHTYVSLIFAVALLVHLALNLRLFSSMVKCILGRR